MLFNEKKKILNFSQKNLATSKSRRIFAVAFEKVP